jgi:L-amino acid N-acyltransferase YncA
MKMPAEPERNFPVSFRLNDRTIIVRRLSADFADAMVRFSQMLPEDDLLFLDRDITRRPVVDRWIQEVAAGSLVTIVALQDDAIVGYATLDRGNAHWTRHVGELRVVVAESARGLSIGRLLLELVFEISLQEGATKLVARMTPDQLGAQKLFKRLGFEEEAILRDHALDANGLLHDLLVLSLHTRLHQENRCGFCGIPVLTALSLDGVQLCSHCYESQYQELGGDG